jgi:hypothetical protein
VAAATHIGRNLPPARTLMSAASQDACETRVNEEFAMAAGGKKAVFRVAAGLLAIGLLTLSYSAPASAQSIFERIFGGLRRAVEAPRVPANVPAFADPFTSLANATNPQPSQRVETGPARAFCVRTCDGRYFPVQAHAGVSAAESCRSFCPAGQTRLYSGGNIDYAVANDGSRYADLDNAFVYRKQLVAGCTCNGLDQFGLAPVDVKTDATLRPGDIVATKNGLVAFTGAKNNIADFTPVDSYRAYSKSYRDKLSQVKIQPPNPRTTSTIPLAADKARSDDRRSAQLSK